MSQAATWVVSSFSVPVNSNTSAVCYFIVCCLLSRLEWRRK